MTRAPLAAALALAALAFPAGASAANKPDAVCSWNLSTHVLTIAFKSYTYATVALSNQGNGNIELDGTSCAQTASIYTVDKIVVTNPSHIHASLTVEDPAAFAPGFTKEAASSEIEWDVDLDDDQSSISLLEPATGGSVVVGADGVNVDPVADAAGGVDADMTLNGVNLVEMVGGGGPDELDGRGGSGTGGAANVKLWGYLEGGNDILHGGNDNDNLAGGLGNDVIDGGPGEDDLVMADLGAAVAVDLRQSGPQDTVHGGVDTITNMEDVTGTTWDDVIHGNDGANEIQGREGNDTLFGEGGNDVLTGNAGMDSIFTGAGHDLVDGIDGEVDTVHCDTGTDTLNVDAIDTLTGCVDTPADPAPSPSPSPTATVTATATATATSSPTPDATATPTGTDPQTPAGGGDGGPTAPHGGGDAPQTPGGDAPKGSDSVPLVITAPRQSARSVRKRGLKVRLTNPQEASIALHAEHGNDVFWHLEAGRRLTIRLRVSRRAARRGRVKVTAALDGAAQPVTRTVRFR